METDSNGIVYLIGAGPGDPELITIKGKLLLQNCDAVIYDNLIPAELIITLPESTEKIYVGKKAGNHTMPQAEINELIFKLAAEGKKVARVKGGDPFIFGRGGEEARYLREHGIKYEIIPGITAGIAGPTFAGIPCTDREISSFVIFATGHKAREKELSPVPWDKIADLQSGTLVIYMGVAEFTSIVETLIDNGISPVTPAAVIERGTFSTQRVFTAPLNELVVKAIEEKIKPPALFVIGEVVDLQRELEWFKNKPLIGHRIMVLRPADQAKFMYKNLRDLGAEVLPYPTIATRKAQSSEWDKLEEYERSDNESWLVFTSENGVRYFMDEFVNRYGDIRMLGKFKTAAVGYGTARALDKFNLKADFIPNKATTEILAKQMTEKYNLKGSNIIRVRGNLGDQRVENILTETGAQVTPLTVYETYYPQWPDGFKEKLFEFPPDIIIFTSGSTVDGFFRMLNEDEINELTEDARLVSIGPMTSERIRQKGLKVSIEATEHSIPGIIDKLKDELSR